MEVDISKELPCHILAILPNEIEVDLPIEFEHTFKFFIIYRQLGHNTNEESQQQQPTLFEWDNPLVRVAHRAS